MLVYTEIQHRRSQFLALTGLTVPEFEQLLPAFSQAYDRFYGGDLTSAGQPRRRFAGGGRHGMLRPPEQKLLFILVYLKAYPLHALMAELFGFSVTHADP